MHKIYHFYRNAGVNEGENPKRGLTLNALLLLVVPMEPTAFTTDVG
jgi:hypothetical protein